MNGNMGTSTSMNQHKPAGHRTSAIIYTTIKDKQEKQDMIPKLQRCNLHESMPRVPDYCKDDWSELLHPCYVSNSVW